MSRDVLPLGSNVCVDVKFQIAITGKRAGTVDRPIKEVREPEQVVLLPDSPVEVDAPCGIRMLTRGELGRRAHFLVIHV